MEYIQKITRTLLGLLLFSLGSYYNIQANVGLPPGKPSASASAAAWG